MCVSDEVKVEHEMESREFGAGTEWHQAAVTELRTRYSFAVRT